MSRTTLFTFRIMTISNDINVLSPWMATCKSACIEELRQCQDHHPSFGVKNFTLLKKLFVFCVCKWLCFWTTQPLDEHCTSQLCVAHSTRTCTCPHLQCEYKKIAISMSIFPFYTESINFSPQTFLTRRFWPLDKHI